MMMNVLYVVLLHGFAPADNDPTTDDHLSSRVNLLFILHIRDVARSYCDAFLAGSQSSSTTI